MQIQSFICWNMMNCMIFSFSVIIHVTLKTYEERTNFKDSVPLEIKVQKFCGGMKIATIKQAQ